MGKYMNTRALSQYLGINEKKIYTLITEKKLPATKITGKWVFLRELVDMWLEESIENYPEMLQRLKGILMLAGSNDPLLDLTMNEIKNPATGFFPFRCNSGSLQGLLMLKTGKAHLTAAHLLDTETAGYNIPFIDTYLPGLRLVAINFAYRQQGLMVKKDNPLGIKGFEDLTRPDIKFINRQQGSGTRVLMDSYLKKLGLTPSKIHGYQLEVTTHFEVGLSLLRDTADVGLGIEVITKMLPLGFIPLKKERFDLLIPKSQFFSREVQTLLEILRSRRFKKMADQLGGYDVSDSGKIIYTC